MATSRRKRRQKKPKLTKKQLLAVSVGMPEERAKRLGDDGLDEYNDKSNSAAAATIRVVDQVGRLSRRKDADGHPSLDAYQVQAAERFEATFHLSGLDPARATDYSIDKVDGGTNKPMPEFVEEARLQHGKAVKAMGGMMWPAVVALVLHNASLLDIAALDAYAHNSGSREARSANALMAVKWGLAKLAIHYGLCKTHRDWKG